MGGAALKPGEGARGTTRPREACLPGTPRGEVTAVLLCGGAGRRVGGADKPLLEWRGRPLVEHVIACIRPQVTRLLISANRNLAAYAGYGEVVTDATPGFAGPLAGILAALEACGTPWLLACAGDAPDLPDDLMDQFCTALRDSGGPDLPAAVAAHDGARLQPLPLLVHVSVRASLQAYLERGERSVHGWLAELGPAVAAFAGRAADFRSRNTLRDLADEPQPPICDCR